MQVWYMDIGSGPEVNSRVNNRQIFLFEIAGADLTLL